MSADLAGGDLGDSESAGHELVGGVLGGLGPEATLDFFARVIRIAEAERDQDHIHLIINNNPKTPNRNDAIAGRGPSSAPALVDMAKALAAAGADFLVMACNAAHAFEADIRAATALPFVSIIDVTMDACLQRYPGMKRIGVLVAEGARDARLYERALERHGIEPVVLSDASQASLMALIYRIKAGDLGPELRSAVRGLAMELTDAGAEAIIAGCTEVPLVLASSDLTVPLIDSTQILAEATVAYARGERLLPTIEHNASLEVTSA
ncbi:MAG: amino acid racemase [Pseudomonadota bacterium]